MNLDTRVPNYKHSYKATLAYCVLAYVAYCGPVLISQTEMNHVPGKTSLALIPIWSRASSDRVYPFRKEINEERRAKGTYYIS